MERVVFLIEPEGTRIPALLNPESLTITRRSGLRSRAGAGGAILGGAQADDPLIATGGGVTELELYLLFDTDLKQQLDPAQLPGPVAADPASEMTAPPDADGLAPHIRPEPDVRDMTRPLWSLAEAPDPGARRDAPPLVRFIWGRAWNMPVAVVAVAERLERFGPGGTPQRSWLSLRLRRIAEPVPPDPETVLAPALPDLANPDVIDAISGDTRYIQSISDPDGNTATPLWLVSAQTLGAAALWPIIAAASGIEDPLKIPPGSVLTVPQPDLGGAG